MRRHLYFVCPTDGLEPVIEQEFKQENYFLTSLGNSLKLDPAEISEVCELLLTKDIREVSFILSDDNKVFLDALEKNEQSELSDLNSFYDQLRRRREVSGAIWQTGNLNLIVLSHHLNDKIKRLKVGLDALPIEVKIGGKIYNRERQSFSSIYPDLICHEHVSLN